MRLYAELARSNVMLVLERENKLMNMEAAASSISHELKQPLGSIALNCEKAKLLLHRPRIGLAPAAHATNADAVTASDAIPAVVAHATSAIPP